MRAKSRSDGRKPFRATVRIGAASVRKDDDPGAWKSVRLALRKSGSLAVKAKVIAAMTVRFDGDLDDPANFSGLAFVSGSLDYASLRVADGAFGDLIFEVAGKARCVDSEKLEDLFHAIVIEIEADGSIVSVGDWEEYGIEVSDS